MDAFVVAECHIRQLHARFLDAVWRQDAGEFASCFSVDGEWKIGGLHFVGRAAIEEACPKLLGRCSDIQLVPLPGLLEVSGDAARGRHHMIEFAKLVDGSSAMTIGVYHDNYAFEDGRWRFSRRFWSLKYRGPADLSADFLRTANYGPFPAAPAVDEETYSTAQAAAL